MQAKITAIEQYPVSTTKKELICFLGLVGYYRSFCKYFSTMVAPLTDLLKARAKYVWSASCQQAFENGRSLLCSPSVFVAPCMDHLFQLQEDASDVGDSAVLFQTDDNGVERPVSFFCHKLNPYYLN